MARAHKIGLRPKLKTLIEKDSELPWPKSIQMFYLKYSCNETEAMSYSEFYHQSYLADSDSISICMCPGKEVYSFINLAHCFILTS
jgi:hypothetical protein